MKVFILALAVAAGAAGPDRYAPGRYATKVSGLLCHSCALALEQELAKLEELEAPRADFEAESLELTVRPGKTLKAKTLRKALQRAAKKINLDTKFEAADLKPVP